ncbi:MAG: NAD(P)/FAD-dependent oxidoreductase [Anaerolineae bacterium]|nr:NAD(P)/FAD-dependent oxidoreductase [Anaerolineae bacterium]
MSQAVPNKTIAIIGAGIAGLATGCYAQMNGYRTQIFELHDKPGGLCTSWKRKGYTIDGCLHWLVGSREGSAMNGIWRELGAVQGREMVDHDEFVRYEGAGGRTFILYTNIDRLERHLLELAPTDAREIGKLCRLMRRFTRMDEAMGGSPIKMLPLLPAMIRYGRMPLEKYAKRFSDPFLREALGSLFDLPDFPMIGMLITLAWMHNRNAGYPIGGSLAFSQAIEQRYLDLGGEIHYKSRVDRILVEADPAGGDRAVGVQLTDGSEHRADIVVSAADGHATIFKMLEGKYVDDTIRGYYDKIPTFSPIIQVSLGVDRDLSAEPQSVSFPLASPLRIAEADRPRLTYRHLAYDQTQAPEGKSVVEVMMESDYGYWKALAEDDERYESEKKDVAIKVMGALERRFPGIEGQVEMVDVATPLTFERFTGNWKGSMEGWLLTTKTVGMMFGPGIRKTLPGLRNLHMVGQWVAPGGGVPTSAQGGRTLVRKLCKQDGKKFVASEP